MALSRGTKRSKNTGYSLLSVHRAIGTEWNNNPQRKHSRRHICRCSPTEKQKDENKDIKEGKTPREWEKKENKHKKAQKDINARWVTKNKERHYGYKDHIKIDKKSKIIIKYRVTSAEVHDSQELKNLIDKNNDRRLYGDSAYTGEEVQKCIPKNILNRIHEKGYRNRPLTKTQKRNNTAKSKIRARVEHVFAAMEQYGGLFIRTIGIKRAEMQIGLLNLAYNLKRYAYLMEAHA